jgi:4-hydroxythreonine-4-phosphate dehydrogenase
MNNLGPSSATEETTKFRPRIGITIGDINGIGPEVVVKCITDRRLQSFFEPVLVGSRHVLATTCETLGILDLEFRVEREMPEEHSRSGRDESVLVIDPVFDEEPPIRVGKITETAGRIAMSAVGLATDLCVNGQIDALVTGPISKEAIHLAGFRVPGHTEFIAARSKCELYTMMMIAQGIRIGLATTHLPLRDVPSNITVGGLVEKLQIIDNSLQRDFGIQRPKIGVLGLNPHAGDGGVIGDEETEIVFPALEQVRDEGRLVFGPFPADGFFATRKFGSFDAVLAMYHDQGLAPFKLLSFNTGINFTAGLPIVRTSPDHGTAFDIAGKGVASPESMRNALYLALDVARRRRKADARPSLADTESVT